jgi:hypothetical protein
VISISRHTLLQQVIPSLTCLSRLNRGSNHIRLCGLKRWTVGEEKKKKAKGSELRLEHFLHLRALIREHDGEAFPLGEMVESKYVDAAEQFLGDWRDFKSYIQQVPIKDPAIDVDSLGQFAGAKKVQNQVLLGPHLGPASVQEETPDSFQDSNAETPFKKKRIVDFHMEPPGNDADDEQIVNEALISFASALTRKWMVQRTVSHTTDQTPVKGSRAGPDYSWRTAADWTMTRDRFHIRERSRGNDRTQQAHMGGLMKSRRKEDFERLSDGHCYGRVLTSETDGSLYCIGTDSTEILALVEAKKRLRKKNRLQIEWQEAAEMLAWLNGRLRYEDSAKKQGIPIQRRGMLKSKPATGKSREKFRYVVIPDSYMAKNNACAPPPPRKKEKTNSPPGPCDDC